MAEMCQTDEDGNTLDSITLDVIPNDRLLKVKSGSTMHCFDTAVLARLKSTGDGTNPYTREQFPSDVTKKVDKHIIDNTYELIINVQGTTRTLNVLWYKRLGDVVVQLIEKLFNDLVKLGEFDIFIEDKSIYDKDLEAEFESVAADKSVIISLVPFMEERKRNKCMLKLLNFLSPGHDLDDTIKVQTVARLISGDSSGFTSTGDNFASMYTAIRPGLLESSGNRRRASRIVTVPSSTESVKSNDTLTILMCVIFIITVILAVVFLPSVIFWMIIFAWIMYSIFLPKFKIEERLGFAN